MKKISTLLTLILILMFALTGCSPAVATYDYAIPWDTASMYEYTEYKISRYYYLPTGYNPSDLIKPHVINESGEELNKILIASGTYTSEIFNEGKNFVQKQNLVVNYVPQQTYTQEMLGDIYQEFLEDMGKTETFAGAFGTQDKVSSTVIFSMEAGKNFTPISMEKIYDMKSINQYVTVAYDYIANKLSYNLDGTDKTLTFKAKKARGLKDNEQFITYLRAINKINNSYWGNDIDITINNVANWTDTALNSKDIMSYTLTASLSEDSLALSDEFRPFVTDAGADYKHDVFKAEIIKKSTKESGRPIIIYFSQNPIEYKNKKLNRLMLKYIQEEFDITTKTKLFATQYNLVAIDTEKA